MTNVQLYYFFRHGNTEFPNSVIPCIFFHLLFFYKEPSFTNLFCYHKIWFVKERQGICLINVSLLSFTSFHNNDFGVFASPNGTEVGGWGKLEITKVTDQFTLEHQCEYNRFLNNIFYGFQLTSITITFMLNLFHLWPLRAPWKWPTFY